MARKDKLEDFGRFLSDFEAEDEDDDDDVAFSLTWRVSWHDM